MIVLLTDFGESEYVGMMKGVIYSIWPAAQVTDLTHSIEPQNIREGAWVLLQSYKFFPQGTIFVCVVDPGVGTSRGAVAAKTRSYTFIGPDNGLMYPAVMEDGLVHIHNILVDEYGSKTFQGRDVFARVGALFAINRNLEDLGDRKQSLDVELEFFQRDRAGEVVRIDRFGNIITNIPPSDAAEIILHYNESELTLERVNTYAEGPDEGIFVLTGSSGTLEIAAKNNQAVKLLPMSIGDRLVLD